MTKAYIVQHTHWDREWYFTAEDAKVLSDQVFTEALDELERNPHVNFTLDGQSSIVDEYLEINPERLDQIKKFMREGRLFVGPWYTQTDALLVDAESILRNLIIGINDTKNKYGQPMMVGYLPDTFGFNAQLPTLLNHAGINSFMAWRGIDFKNIIDTPYFNWKGLSNQSVTAMYFPYGYMTGLMTLDAINDIPKFVEEKLDPSIKFLADHGNNSDILIPSGIDQKSMVLDFEKVIAEINQESDYTSVISNYQDYVKVIQAKDNLPEYQGDLRLPVYSRVHRTISSVRTAMKLDNFYLEQKILRRVEPLMVIAKKLDVQISTGLVTRLWKKVLENQAHDSIGGCVSDNVAEDIFHRIKEANEIADGIENLILKRIADALELNANEVLLVNTDPYPYKGSKVVHIMTHSKDIHFKNTMRQEIVGEKFYPERENIMCLTATGYDYINEPSYYELDVKLDVEIPALGYTVIEFEESAIALNEPTSESGAKISNEHYELSFVNNQVVLKGHDVEIQNFVTLVDAGNDGDTYDYSPLGNEKEIELPFTTSSIEKGLYGETLIISGKANLPYNLETRQGNASDYADVNYKVLLTLSETNQIEGRVEFDNQILSHRLRLRLNVLNDDETSYAQIQNGFVKNAPKTYDENWEEYRVEKPVNIEIFDKSVSVLNDEVALNLYADGLREYERVDKHLFITLQATTGELGKPNLAWRPGRASGDTTSEGHIMMPTPLAQEIGLQVYHFAFEVDPNGFDEMKIAKTANRRHTPSISYQRQSLNKFVYRLDNKIWPHQKQALNVERKYEGLTIPSELLVSALYPSYTDDNCYILRLANPSSKEVKLPKELSDKAEIVNAIETVLESQEGIVKPYDYLTLKLSK